MKSLSKIFIGLLVLVLPLTSYASFDVGLTNVEMKYFNKQKEHLLDASRLSGINVTTLAAIGNLESGLGRAVRNKNSSATGVMQYISQSWASDLNKHRKALQLAKNSKRTNDRANILVGGMSLADNKAFLSQYSKTPVTDGDLYMSHFIGLYGAKAVLKGNPNAPVNRYIKVTKGNKRLFYSKGKILTVSQFRSNLNKIVEEEKHKFQTAMVKENQKQMDTFINGLIAKRDYKSPTTLAFNTLF